MTWPTDEWEGCYPSKWKGMIVPGAMTHPAKFSSRLIRRIYEHMLQEGWLKAGDTVIDPFGGVALGALDAMRLGLRWRGMELEARFAELGNQNIGFWNAKFSRMPGWCQDATLLQGDSRHLIEALQGADTAVTSPPYSEARIGQESGQEHCGRGDQYGGGATPGQLGAMKAEEFDSAIASPPYTANLQVEVNSKSVDLRKQWENYRRTGGMSFEAFSEYQRKMSQGYGNSPGNLGNMKDSGFDSAVASPPFRQATGGTPEPKPGGPIDAGLYQRHAAGNSSAEGYGATDGQLANMPEGDFDATLSSPPYEAVQIASIPGSGTDIELRKKLRASGEWEGYNRENKDNLGSNAGDDFWMAARQIVEQVYMVLRPGAHAVWVAKGFVKNKELVDFPGQWRQLCEAVGFAMVHEHHAMLVHHKGASHTLEGGIVEHKTESKSFFRRLAESKGSPRIDYETILCMVKGEA